MLAWLFRFASCFSANSTQINGLIIGNHTRVQIISPTLVRVEKKGLMGFEDRTTFMVTRRFQSNITLTVVNESETGTWLSAGELDILVRPPTHNVTGFCSSSVKPHTAVEYCGPGNSSCGPAYRVDKFPSGIHAHDMGACCSMCESEQSCAAWTFQQNPEMQGELNCMLLSAFAATIETDSEEFFGCSSRGCARAPDVRIQKHGVLLFDSTSSLERWAIVSLTSIP
jgi:hypothetical protein